MCDGPFTVNQTLFIQLEKLLYLKMGFADMLEITKYAFIRLPRLEAFEFQRSYILHLKDYSFEGLTALKKLSLANPILTIFLQEKVFKPLTSLQELSLEGVCSLQSPAFDCSAVAKRLQYVPSLKILYIDKAMLSQFENGFLSLTNLEELYLINGMWHPHFDIRYIYPKVFENLQNTTLTKFSLDRCYV